MTLVNPFAVINRFCEKYPVNVEALAMALGIDVRYVALGKDVSGMIERNKGGKYVISINEDDYETRQRFTLAHELGHFIYHKNKMENGIDDDRAYRSTDVGKYHNTQIGRREEIQANRFAANLLMPANLIRKLQQEELSVEDMAQRLEVSPKAMEIRLNGLER